MRGKWLVQKPRPRGPTSICHVAQAVDLFRPGGRLKGPPDPSCVPYRATWARVWTTWSSEGEPRGPKSVLKAGQLSRLGKEMGQPSFPKLLPKRAHSVKTLMIGTNFKAINTSSLRIVTIHNIPHQSLSSIYYILLSRFPLLTWASEADPTKIGRPLSAGSNRLVEEGRQHYSPERHQEDPETTTIIVATNFGIWGKGIWSNKLAWLLFINR